MSLAAMLGAALHKLLTPVCPAGAVCIFGAVPSAPPYVEYAEVPSYWAVYDVQRRAYAVKSPFQYIEVFDTYFHGRILTIDGALMITERDERNYHEMLAHVPLNYLPDARRVLVVGGGDGGTVTQVVRHPGLKEVYWVEIDELVVRTAQRFFPRVCEGLRDPRVKLVIRDASHWVAEQQFGAFGDGAPGDQGFDVVLIDSTDFNRAEPLFSPHFYRSVKALMGPRSILCFNVDSPQWGQVRLVQFFDRVAELFKHVYVFQVFQPTYTSGHYAFIFASDSMHPTATAVDWARWRALNLETRYYNSDVHYAAFMLPTQVRDVLRHQPMHWEDIRH